VAGAIRKIVEGGPDKLRYPVGPGAAEFIAWRKSRTDEEMVEWGAMEDDAWYDRVQQNFGYDARPKE